MQPSGQSIGGKGLESEKARDVRSTNIIAARAVADVVRTSLGPRGMDKMIQDQRGRVLITNDGATILKQMSVIHPTAKMLVEISAAQDIEAGDGTTSVVVMAGALLKASQELLNKGIHPAAISDGFSVALEKAKEIIEAAGGSATRVHYNKLGFRALLKPHKFPDWLPRPARPPLGLRCQVDRSGTLPAPAPPGYEAPFYYVPDETEWKPNPKIVPEGEKRRPKKQVGEGREDYSNDPSRIFGVQ